MQYCVIGAGAMGGLYGLSLARKGHSVSFLDIDQQQVDAINAGGFRLSGATGDFTLPVTAETDSAALAGSADIVLFHPHTTGTADAAGAAATVLKPTGWAVSLQNGIGNVEALSAALGAERVVGGISYHSASRGDPGHAIHTNAGKTYIGELSGGGSERVEALAEAMREAGLNPEVATDVISEIWTKFVHNCAINAICAVSGLRTGDVARNEAASALQLRILQEAMAVVEAKGLTLTHDDTIAYITRQTRLRYIQPSMQQHMEAARPTEIDSLNGALVREGEALGVATPFNEALVMMVKAREAAMALNADGVERDFALLEAAAKSEAAALAANC